MCMHTCGRVNLNPPRQPSGTGQCQSAGWEKKHKDKLVWLTVNCTKSAIKYLISRKVIQHRGALHEKALLQHIFFQLHEMAESRASCA